MKKIFTLLALLLISNVSDSNEKNRTLVQPYDPINNAYMMVNPDGSINVSCVGGGSGGTVTSVDLTLPNWLTVTGNPITSSGTIAVTGASQTQNLILASPNGSSGAVSPRTMVAADIPNTAVTPGSYTLAGITVDAQGRITSAASGSGGTGTVTTASVVSANGFNGSFANPTTTPALTLATTITGMLKGVANALVAAVAGTDYALPNGTTNLAVNPDSWLWSHGTSVTVANGVSTYEADNFYVKNSLGTNGVITYSQTTTAAPGSTYGMKVQITTAPTAGQTNGAELWQTLSNQDSMAFYNGSGSLSIQVQALSNVNQVGIQFFYATTQTKATVAIGSEATCSVNSSGMTLCSTSNISMGTSMTTTGTIGYRLRITGVSSGNTYDLNNGFIASQYQLNTGAIPGTFYRPPLGTMIKSAQQYIFAMNAPPYNVTSGHLWTACLENSTTTVYCSIMFPTPMIAVPTYTAVAIAGFKVADGGGNQTISAVTQTIRMSNVGGQVEFTGSGFTAAATAIEIYAVNNTVWQYFTAEL